MTNVKNVLTGIRSLSSDEVKVVTAALNTRIKELRDAKASTFTVGQKVSFNSKRAGAVYGTVEKVNKATIIVRTPTTIWKVSPALLNAA